MTEEAWARGKAPRIQKSCARRCWRVLLIVAWAGLLSGCAGITVRKIEQPGLFQAWQASVAGADELSARTLQTLRRLDLDAVYQTSPGEAVGVLHRLAVQDPQPELLFALAEISYVLAGRLEKGAVAEACAHYYLCAGYAYHYLFPHEPQATQPNEISLARAEGASPFDPRFRVACELYNAALAKCIQAAQQIGRLDPRRRLDLPAPEGGGFALTVRHQGFPWPPEEFGPLLLAADHAVVGLANHYHTYGLGVPLIGTRIAQSTTAPGEAFYPRDVSFPVTAFFRFEGTLADLGGRRAGQLELYNPLTIQTVAVRDQLVPLESDLTTPLAYFLAHTDLEGLEYAGFLKSDTLRQRTGVYLFEPYQPGKIPIVFVHGLLSSPLTWAPMFNDLRADPLLRERFQFWFYLYPTGNPYLATAADLRQALARLRAELDPAHQDQALERMVFIGHSMGGLISKLLTVDSKDDFWRLVSEAPFATLKGDESARNEVQHIFYFQPQPFIGRVVFLGTPHHGSKLSPSPLARLVERYVEVPETVRAAFRDLVRQNPEARFSLRPERLPSSVDLLAPGAAALELLAARTQLQGVHFHSIIGFAPSPSPVRKLGALLGESAERSDGVVPYISAHLDGVDSELIIPADHTHVHQHPLAVLEVRRILLEHLRATLPREDREP